MATKPETNFRKKVRDNLKELSLGLPLWFEPIQQKAIKGSPDFILCANGHFIALELKTEDGIISAVQSRKLQAVLDAGGLSLVAHPGNWRSVLKTINFYLEDKNDCNGTHQISEEAGNNPKTSVEAS